MIKTIRPLGNRVLVKRKEDEPRTPTIFIPESAKVKSLEGIIVAISPDLKEKKINVGETVLFTRYAGMELDIDSEEHVVLLYTDIVGVIEREEKPTK